MTLQRHNQKDQNTKGDATINGKKQGQENI